MLLDFAPEDTNYPMYYYHNTIETSNIYVSTYVSIMYYIDKI